MKSVQFTEVFEQQVERCREVLVKKAEEYATDVDRLHNFKAAAGFNSTTPQVALWGMLTKHLVSLSDMINSGEKYSRELWQEKIGDSLNYLFLLNALVEEQLAVEANFEATWLSNFSDKKGDINAV